MAGTNLIKPNTEVQIPKDKLKYAKKLADSHINIESTISGVAYITSASEQNKSEPIKLLEINSATSASGFFPVAFGPSNDIPYNSTLVELTPDEAKKLERKQLDGWPKDWEVGKWLFKRRKKGVRGRK